MNIRFLNQYAGSREMKAVAAGLEKPRFLRKSF